MKTSKKPTPTACPRHAATLILTPSGGVTCPKCLDAWSRVQDNTERVRRPLARL